jgi:hypothetical protein
MKKRPRAVRSIFAAAGVTVLSLVWSASLAGAAGGSGGSHATFAKKITVPMIAVPITSVTIPSSGTAIVHLANGASLPTTRAKASTLQPSGTGAQPNNISTGTCGTSWIWVFSNSNTSGVNIYTGYKIKTSVLGSPEYFYWYVYGSNVSYNRPFTRLWAGSQNATTWTAGFGALKGAGTYKAWLSVTSYVEGTKAYCYSKGAYTETVVL